MSNKNPRFFSRHLDFSDQIGEALFAMIMAMGFTIAVRMGMGDADNRTLFIAILGCNTAWALVDAIIYILLTLYERMHQAHVIALAQQPSSDAATLAAIRDSYDETLAPITTENEREALYQRMLVNARQKTAVKAKLHGGDFVSAFALAMVSLVLTVPILVPFLLVDEPLLAVRASNAVGIVLLFLLGYAWATRTSGRPYLLGFAMAMIGVVMTVMTILLGG